ncbi:proliferating cell nuclear antigen (pcna) [Candidatus Woesearchaeota archaeon]|nr:proliferating cell nuclear antigen (pcna) [Candidatus Woesearchaeota archaeon]
MKLILTEPRLLTESIGIISELVNEATLKIDKTKIEIIAMDPANVAMIDFKLLSPAFAEYEVNEDVSLTINLDNFKQILKRAKPADTTIISLDEDTGRLKIELIGESKKTFNLSLIDAEEREQKIPKLSFAASIETASIKFDEAIEDMGIIAESVALIAEPKKLTIKSEGNLQDAKVEIHEDENTKISTEDKTTAKYSIEYLKKIIKGSKISDEVSISFATNYPLKTEYTIIDKMRLSFILAPRVDND